MKGFGRSTGLCYGGLLTCGRACSLADFSGGFWSMAWNMANADLLPATLTFLDLAEGSSASPDVARPARAPVRPRVDDCCLLKYSTGGPAARRAEERRLPRVGGSLDILRDSFEYESFVAIELDRVNDGVHV